MPFAQQAECFASLPFGVGRRGEDGFKEFKVLFKKRLNIIHVAAEWRRVWIRVFRICKKHGQQDSPVAEGGGGCTSVVGAAPGWDGTKAGMLENHIKRPCWNGISRQKIPFHIAFVACFWKFARQL